jgi:hypothetical protein
MSQALTHSPTKYSMQQVILEKAAFTQLVKNSLSVYESKGSLLLSLGPNLNVMCPVHILITYYFKINFNIILPSMSLCLPIGFLASDFLTKILHAFLISSYIRYMHCHLIRLDMIP